MGRWGERASGEWRKLTRGTKINGQEVTLIKKKNPRHRKKKSFYKRKDTPKVLEKGEGNITGPRGEKSRTDRKGGVGLLTYKVRLGGKLKTTKERKQRFHKGKGFVRSVGGRSMLPVLYMGLGGVGKKLIY